MAAPAAPAPSVRRPHGSDRPALVAREARKWRRVFSVFVQDALVYRAVAVVWILTDTIPALVMPLLWRASFNGRATIAGFSPSDFTAYYLVLLLVTNLIQCHVMWDMATEIKEGRFSSFLIRPFSYRAMHYLGFLAWRLMRTVLFLPVFALVVFVFRHSLHWQDYQAGGPFFASLILGHFVSFFTTYAFGLLALFFVETRSLFNFWYMPLIIFSGQLAPLALFPPGWQTVAKFLPFRYTIALPTEIFLGRLSPAEVAQGMLAQVVWIIVGYAGGSLLWRAGLKRFTGVGL